MNKRFYNRPLSPHLTIYTPQLSSTFSIWHRISGVLLICFISVAFLFIKNMLLFFINNSIFLYFFIKKNSFLWFFNTFVLNVITIFIYHLLNGVRHLAWDLGFLLKLVNVNRTSLYIVFLIIIFNLYLINKLL